MEGRFWTKGGLLNQTPAVPDQMMSLIPKGCRAGEHSEGVLVSLWLALISCVGNILSLPVHIEAPIPSFHPSLFLSLTTKKIPRVTLGLPDVVVAQKTFI